MNRSVRIAIGFFIGYTAYFAAALVLGVQIDDAGDLIRLCIKGLLVVFAAVSAIEWVARRRGGPVLSSQTLSVPPAPRPTASVPPTEG